MTPGDFILPQRDCQLALTLHCKHLHLIKENAPMFPELLSSLLQMLERLNHLLNAEICLPVREVALHTTCSNTKRT